MNSTVQTVHCPNCGSLAERHHILSSQVTRTQCEVCDYLMVMCDRTGKVIEAYAPGISVAQTSNLLSISSLRSPQLATSSAA